MQNALVKISDYNQTETTVVCNNYYKLLCSQFISKTSHSKTCIVQLCKN
jgi:hypothetical protein